jgi:hypothetical protein
MRRAWLSLAFVLALGGAALAGALEDRIRDLGSDDFQKREAATAWLSSQGQEASSALAAAAKDKDPEVRWRATKALEAIRARGGQPAEAGKPARPRAPEPPHSVEPPPGGAAAPELGDALERARKRLRDIDEQMKQLRPGVHDFMQSFGGGELDFDKIFEEMERRFRDLNRDPGAGGGGQGGLGSDFWSFRYKDGKWELVRPDDAASTRVGLRTQPVPPVLRAQLRLEGELDGLVVEEVASKGIAADAGLAQWDLILAIDGKAARGEPDLEALLAPGPHRIAIVRGGERKELAVTTPATPAAPEAAPRPELTRPPQPQPVEPPKKDELRKY